MKETQPQHTEPAEQVQQAQAKNGQRFKGRMILKPGHKVFEINLITGAIVEAKYESAAVSFKNQTKIRNLVEKESCIYLPALNKKNAKRHFDNIIKKVKRK